MTATGTRAEAVLAAVDSGDVESLLDLVDENITYRFGNDATMHGRAAIAKAARAFTAAVDSVHHEFVDQWEPEPDVAVALLEVTYRRLDGHEVRLPCCTMFRFSGGLVVDYRIYMDSGPVYAP